MCGCMAGSRAVETALSELSYVLRCAACSRMYRTCDPVRHACRTALQHVGFWSLLGGSGGLIGKKGRPSSALGFHTMEIGLATPEP